MGQGEEFGSLNAECGKTNLEGARWKKAKLMVQGAWRGIRKWECGMRKKEFGKVEKGKAHGAGSIEKNSEVGMWNAEKMN